MPGSTDKNQQNGPQKAESQTQESLVPASPHHPNQCKTQKPKTARGKAEAVPGSTVRVGQNHEKTPPSKQKNLKKMTAAIHFTGVVPGGSGVIATRGLCKNQMHHQRTITPHQPAPRPEQRRKLETVSSPARVRGSISAQPRPW